MHGLACRSPGGSHSVFRNVRGRGSFSESSLARALPSENFPATPFLIQSTNCLLPTTHLVVRSLRLSHRFFVDSGESLTLILLGGVSQFSLRRKVKP
jgi:hypothetical protein